MVCSLSSMFLSQHRQRRITQQGCCLALRFFKEEKSIYHIKNWDESICWLLVNNQRRKIWCVFWYKFQHYTLLRKTQSIGLKLPVLLKTIFWISHIYTCKSSDDYNWNQDHTTCMMFYMILNNTIFDLYVNFHSTVLKIDGDTRVQNFNGTDIWPR